MDRSESSRARLEGVARVTRDPALRRLSLAYAGYNLTEFASWIVLLVYAFERGGVLESGLAAAGMLLPASLAVPWTTRIGANASQKSVLMMAYGVIALACAACAAALAADVGSLGVYTALLVLCMAISCARPFQVGTLVALTDKAETLTAANVVNGLIESLCYFAGPALAALLLAWAGAWSVFAVLAITMSFASISIARIRDTAARGVAHRVDPIASDTAAPSDPPSQEGEGHARGAAALIALLASREVLIGAIDVLFVSIAFELLGSGDSGAARLNAAFGLGLVGGAIVSVNQIGSTRVRVWIVAAGLTTALAIVALGLARSELAAGLLLAAAGAGTLVAEVSTRTLLQRITPGDRLASTFGIVESAGLVMLAIGILGTAFVIDHLGITPSLLALALLLTAVALSSYPAIRRLERMSAAPSIRTIRILRSLPLFRALDAPALEALARSAEIVDVAGGTTLIEQGGPPGPFFVLVEGRVAVRLDGELIRSQGPGEYFGEISALEGVPRTATVETTTPVVALAIDPDRFVAAITSHPGSLALARGVISTRRFAPRAPAS